MLSFKEFMNRSENTNQPNYHKFVGPSRSENIVKKSQNTFRAAMKNPESAFLDMNRKQ